MKIYVASSWRNLEQPEVVRILRSVGHEVYDFRNPSPDDCGFSWAQTGETDKITSPRLFRDQVLTHPIARDAFSKDMTALKAADATVLVLPCGRSAHLELGYAVGAGQKTLVLLENWISEPELMYLMCTKLCLSIDEVVGVLGR